MMNTLTNKIQNTIEFLKSINKENNKSMIYVKFSGGKDSCVLKDIISKNINNLNFIPNYVLLSVGLDSKYLREFLSEYHPEVKILTSKKTFFDACVENNMFPNIFNCFCCSNLLNPIAIELEETNDIIIDGVKFYDTDNNIGLNKIWQHKEEYAKHYSPLWDWTDEDIAEYIALNNIPLHKDYNIFGHSYGCYFCPGNITDVKKAQVELDPELTEKLKLVAKTIYENNISVKKRFDSYEEYFLDFIGPKDNLVALFNADRESYRKNSL